MSNRNRNLPRRLANDWLFKALVACVAFGAGLVFIEPLLAESPHADVEFFEKEIRPILVEHCYECHAGEEASGGLLLDSRAGWMRGGDTGAAIVPQDAEESLLIEAVRYRNQDLQMPPDGRLSAAEITSLEKWVSLGAPDPRDGMIQAHAPTGMAVEEGRKFWSFTPVGNPAVPQLEDRSRVNTPIDAFIMKGLQQAGIPTAPVADRRTLIRRVTFNLIGLPPTPAEVDRFLNDDSPDAFEKVIERLLISPQYGIRWGRHWLDVARYADSNGLDENLAFGNAWRYRDYVIDAFNRDKTFDRFLLEQLAGDLLPGANRETKVATGFLSLGAKVLAEPDREKLEMDMIDEQLDATGKAFLGMTFGCVRCHDHKFDPIKQSDYYALAAIFKSTKTMGDSNTGAIKHWNEHVFAEEDELKSFQAIDKEIAAKKKAATDFKNKALTALREDARSKAALYLAAATRFDGTATLKQVAEIAAPMELHPRILHHCRLHLQYHQQDAVFASWHELGSQAKDPDEHARLVQQHYERRFAAVADALKREREANPKAAKIPDADLDAFRLALNDNSGFLAVPPKPEFAFDSETLAGYDQLMEAARVLESRAPDVPAAMGVEDGTVHASLPIHIRGSHRNFGEPVKREFPIVMRSSTVRPIFPAQQSGRLELARWMASTQHPLTARVYVNRVWRWHFGTGLVTSTENFGVLGDRPSHPELLDWLARWFMQSGWSTKELHRLILTSSVYQMASQHPQEALAATVDPENRLRWKFDMQRLESEQLRDAILFASGRLDQSIGGKMVPLRNRQFVFNHTSVDHTKYDSLRRAAYLPVIRNNLYTLFAQFDFPDPTMPTGDRKTTTVAPQALLLMNAPLVIESSDALARGLLRVSTSNASRVETAYVRVLGRSPSQLEVNRALDFVDDTVREGRTNATDLDPETVQRAWALFCQSLFASNEFMYLR
ncbi:MAG: PSD1 and planctomycete cytochrome C domain-containing protein [Rubripirellula sp.]